MDRIREILSGSAGADAGLPAGPEAAPGRREEADAAWKFYRQAEGDATVPLSIKNQVRLEVARAVFEERTEEAGQILERIRATRPQEPLKGEVDFLSARYFDRKGDLERARDIYSAVAASRVDRFGASAQLALARLLERMDRKEEAAGEYLKVGVLYPAFRDLVAESLYRAGGLLESLGEPRKAQALFEKLRAEHPDSPWLQQPGLSAP
jgi:tetratricopeptide (TPR) repeat protein